MKRLRDPRALFRRRACSTPTLASCLGVKYIPQSTPDAGPNSTPLRLRRHHLYRFALSLLAATVVWLVAPAAHAAGPQCDIRGATTIAPSPTLDTQGGSVDASPADSCSGAAVDHTLQPDHSRSSASLDDQAPRASLSETPRVREAAPSATLSRAAEVFPAPAGVRDRVERPPRG